MDDTMQERKDKRMDGRRDRFTTKMVGLRDTET